MQVQSVRVKRLFNLGSYENEEIGFEARVEEGESPEQVTGQFFLKILEAEEFLDAYRKVLGRIDRLEHSVERETREVANLTESLENMKLELEELERTGETGNYDQRMRRACTRDSFKHTSESRERTETSLREHKKKLDAALELRGHMEKRISQGKFDLKELV